MSDELIVTVLGVALLVELGASLICAWWMRRVYGRRAIESALWDRLVRSQFRVVVANVILGGMVLWTLMARVNPDDSWPEIPRPWGVVSLVISVALLAWGPIEDWWTVRSIVEADISERGEDR